MEISQKRFTQITFIILIILVLFKEIYTDKLENDIKNTNMCTTNEINDEMKKIVLNKKKNISDKMIDACKDGMFKGAISGSILGGVPGAITGGVVYGISSPIIMYVESFTKK